jgi:quercetin dioxygenase-like cupin family protein
MDKLEKYVIPNNTSKIVWDIPEVAEKFTHGREKEVLLRGSFLNVLLIHLTPDAPIPAHYEDYDAVFYILQGKGIIQIASEKIPVQPGRMLFSPKTELRGIFPEEPMLIMGLQEPH